MANFNYEQPGPPKCDSDGNGNDRKCFCAALTVCQALFLVCELAPAPPVSQADAIIIVPIVDIEKPRLREAHTKARLHSQGAGALSHHEDCLSADLHTGVLPKSPGRALISSPPPTSCSPPLHLLPQPPVASTVPRNTGVVSPTQISPMRADMFM